MTKTVCSIPKDSPLSTRYLSTSNKTSEDVRNELKTLLNKIKILDGFNTADYFILYALTIIIGFVFLIFFFAQLVFKIKPASFPRMFHFINYFYSLSVYTVRNATFKKSPTACMTIFISFLILVLWGALSKPLALYAYENQFWVCLFVALIAKVIFQIYIFIFTFVGLTTTDPGLYKISENDMFWSSIRDKLNERQGNPQVRTSVEETLNSSATSVKNLFEKVTLKFSQYTNNDGEEMNINEISREVGDSDKEHLKRLLNKTPENQDIGRYDWILRIPLKLIRIFSYFRYFSSEADDMNKSSKFELFLGWLMYVCFLAVPICWLFLPGFVGKLFLTKFDKMLKFEDKPPLFDGQSMREDGTTPGEHRRPAAGWRGVWLNERYVREGTMIGPFNMQMRAMFHDAYKLVEDYTELCSTDTTSDYTCRTKLNYGLKYNSGYMTTAAYDNDFILTAYTGAAERGDRKILKDLWRLRPNYFMSAYGAGSKKK